MHNDIHAKIARALFRELRLPSEYGGALIKGITAPDRWRRRMPKSKHHYLQGHIIFDRVMDARSFYLKGDLQSCLYNLGIALHFIQDAYLPSPRTKHLRGIHARLEGKIRSLPLPEEEISVGFNSARSSPAFVKDVISKVV